VVPIVGNNGAEKAGTVEFRLVVQDDVVLPLLFEVVMNSLWGLLKGQGGKRDSHRTRGVQRPSAPAKNPKITSLFSYLMSSHSIIVDMISIS
jgi:hypothetical protein